MVDYYYYAILGFFFTSGQSLCLKAAIEVLWGHIDSDSSTTSE